MSDTSLNVTSTLPGRPGFGFSRFLLFLEPRKRGKSNYFIIILCIIIAHIYLSCDNSYCPDCTTSLVQDEVLPSNTEAARVVINWSALNYNRPAAVHPDQDLIPYCVLPFQRSLRASACIWLPQCRIYLNYDQNALHILSDPNLTLGDQGDVLIGEEPSYLTEEFENLLWESDVYWQTQPTRYGLQGLAIKRFISQNTEGDINQATLLGLAIRSKTRSFITVVDPYYYGPPFALRDNDAVIAHELGHILGLCHTDEDDPCNLAIEPDLNLMYPRAHYLRTEIESNQCDLARAASCAFNNVNSDKVCTPINDDEKLQNLYAIAIDSIHELPVYSLHKEFDIYKILLLQSNDLNIVIANNGIVNELPITFWLTFDLDNSINTGHSTKGLVPYSNHFGTDLVLKLSLGEKNTNQQCIAYKIQKNGLSPVKLQKSHVSVKVNAIPIHITSLSNCLSIPVFNEVEISISKEALKSLNIPVRNSVAFSEGLKFQAISEGQDHNGRKIFDTCPDTISFLSFSAYK